MNKIKIEVVEYNNNWAENFLELKKTLLKHMSPLILSLEHIGSTSVPGLAAKPILDIDIIIEADPEIQKKVIVELSELGYKHLGDLGITGREAFKRKDKYTPDDGSQRVWRKHNLYVCRKGSLGLRNHLALRDYLRKNPAECRRYGEIKTQLAEKFPNDIDSYVDGKTEFIVEILEQVGISERDRRKISSENKLKVL